MKRLVLVAVLFQLGCASSTNVVMRRFEQGALRSCVMAIGWTEAELREECGEPDATVQRAGKDGQCLVYASSAASSPERQVLWWRAPALNAPPYVAACLEESRLSKRRERKVAAVLELADVHGIATSTTPR